MASLCRDAAGDGFHWQKAVCCACETVNGVHADFDGELFCVVYAFEGGVAVFVGVFHKFFDGFSLFP